ncbi:MAG: TlpA family protein disulfide reductase [Propionibacteriaceae bacterium]|nr:TlpA family protein disulfide reductase [Propionibacteriaceae bacterium]
MNPKLRTALVLVATTILIVGGVVLVRAPWKTGVTTIDVGVDPNQPVPAVGKTAPEFSQVDSVGEVLRLSELKGKPVWLVFGATWCTNCRAEAPDVEEVWRAYADKAVVISIYVGEDAETVAGYATRLGLTHRQVPDPLKQLSATYAVMGLPTHVFIDPQGVIGKIVVGSISPNAASQHLDAMLS